MFIDIRTRKNFFHKGVQGKHSFLELWRVQIVLYIVLIRNVFFIYGTCYSFTGIEEHCKCLTDVADL